ncbi:MAG: hypothetical protein KGS72_00155 [Cyanobacteria bacterium REEB67]|nr:hypothetical protein [Cyanobacteria bacterium REEB67]
MYEQDIPSQASQLAGAIEQNDLNNAAQMLLADTNGMGRGYARALIDQTNQYTQQDAYRDNTSYDQIRPSGQVSQYGLPVVDFVNGDNQVDTSVALSIRSDYTQPAPYQGYEQQQSYYNRPQEGDGCGGVTLGGAALGAGAGLAIDRHSPLAAGLLALGGGIIADNACEKR